LEGRRATQDYFADELMVTLIMSAAQEASLPIFESMDIYAN
jgi:hypothetical protein